MPELEIPTIADLKRVVVRLGSAESHTVLSDLCVLVVLAEGGFFEAWDTFCETHPRHDEGRDVPPHPAGPDSHDAEYEAVTEEC